MAVPAAPPTTTHHAFGLECPRCGYDMRGVTSEWVEACPIAGHCTECGLPFEWRELFDRTCKAPRWSMEADFVRWRLPRNAISTFLRSAWPIGFWNRMEMRHEVRGKRLAAYIVVVLLLAYFALALFNGYAWYVEMSSWNRFQTGRGWYPGLGKEVLYAIALPFSGFGDTNFGTTPWYVMRLTWEPNLGVLLMPLTFPITGRLIFLALPVTVRAAKVHKRHLFRIGMYGAGYALLCMVPLMFVVTRFESQWVGWRVHAVERWTSIAITAFFLQCLWWLPVCYRYLKLQSSFVVAPLIALVCVLVPIAIAATWWVMSGPIT